MSDVMDLMKQANNINEAFDNDEEVGTVGAVLGEAPLEAFHNERLMKGVEEKMPKKYSVTDLIPFPASPLSPLSPLSPYVAAICFGVLLVESSVYVISS